MAVMAAVEIVGAFTDADCQRGYLCVAPDRTCSPDRTVGSDGVWFRTCALGLLQSAHRTAARSKATTTIN